jgi:imidazoleglycerol-phosphate dehydratase
MAREAVVDRSTSETSIQIHLNLDGKGASKIHSGIPFFDHMLTLFARHGLFDLELDAKGDIEVDFHHTVEDAGITLGQALAKAVGAKEGIRRYGFFYVPMDESLVRVVVDLSGRPQLVEEFLRALAASGGMNLHVDIIAGRDAHHMAEGVFKALARALDMATQLDPRVEGVPSTKGAL